MRLLSIVLFVLGMSLYCTTPAAQTTGSYYDEPYRPQFHFTAEKNWLNDPNGLVYYKGEYHLFYQYNPYGRNWGNMHWGHATSEDMLHWKHQPLAIYPLKGTPDHYECPAYSGSAVIDWNNTSGLQKGDEKTIVAIYTARRCGQRIVYSNDKGKTWQAYPNPVIPVMANGTMDERDPKVFWYEPTKKWVMVLYIGPDKNDKERGIAIYNSNNLLQWEQKSFIKGMYECPDLFELPVDGNPAKKKWVLHAADGGYLVGNFDGSTFTPETGKMKMDLGNNFYAAQSYSDIPKADGRRIQVGWMSGGIYPDAPFNQQMAFPCELTLKKFPEGIRICRNPVAEIKNIYGERFTLKNQTIQPGSNILAALQGDALDIHAVIEPGNGEEFGFVVRKGNYETSGTPVRYDVKNRKLIVLGKSVDLEPVDGKVEVRILVDRASIEVFANGGKISLSSCFIPVYTFNDMEFYCKGGEVKVESMDIYKLKSAWQK
ncbi:MAG TPA: glycoside hydrolase family 32 protein [Agriterribacter sp.]|nr:glycoside hydrolase family 32 protein [Agriterribacter sp.]